MEISAEDIHWMRESLSGIKDTRRQWSDILHKLTDILVLGLCSIVCGWPEFEQMEELGRLKLDFFKRFLELPHGIPDAYTFNRAFSWVQPEELPGALKQWLVESNQDGGRQLNIDGKTIRGSGGKGKKAVHIVSVWLGANRVVLGQCATEEKSNEITAIPKLLDTLEVAGDTITIGAMGCQTATAEKIREKGAHYVLSVKENQPETYGEIKEYFEYVQEEWERNPPQDVWRSGQEKKNHGREESREVFTEEDIDWMGVKEKWKDLKTIILYRCTRKEGEKTTVTAHYYISNLSPDAEEAARIIRGHWSIENNLHWRLDVCFGEDGCRVRTNHGAENLDSLRKIALYLLRKTKAAEKHISLRHKMTRAALDDAFLHKALFGRE